MDGLRVTRLDKVVSMYEHHFFFLTSQPQHLCGPLNQNEFLYTKHYLHARKLAGSSLLIKTIWGTSVYARHQPYPSKFPLNACRPMIIASPRARPLLNNSEEEKTKNKRNTAPSQGPFLGAHVGPPEVPWGGRGKEEGARCAARLTPRRRS